MRGLVLIESEYATRMVGLRERVVAEERLATEGTADQLLKIVDGVCAGKIKPAAVRHAGTVDFEKLEIVEYTRKRDEKSNKNLMVPKRVKLGRKHAQAAKLHRRTRDLRDFDDEGQPIKPYVGITFEDGTSVDVPWTDPPKPKDAAGT